MSRTLAAAAAGVLVAAATSFPLAGCKGDEFSGGAPSSDGGVPAPLDGGDGGGDGGGGDAGGPGGDGAASGCPPGNLHAICVDFEDGTFPPNGFAPSTRNGGVPKLDDTVGFHSARSMIASSAPMNDGTRVASIVHTLAPATLPMHLVAGAEVLVPAPLPAGNFDVLTVRYESTETTGAAWQGTLTVHDGGLYFEEHGGTSFSQVGPFPAGAGTWRRLELDVDVATKRARLDVEGVTVMADHPLLPAGAFDSYSVDTGLTYVSADTVALDVHIDDVTVDFP